MSQQFQRFHRSRKNSGMTDHVSVAKLRQKNREANYLFLNQSIVDFGALSRVAITKWQL